MLGAAVACLLASGLPIAEALAAERCFDREATIVVPDDGSAVQGSRRADVIVTRGSHLVIGRGGNDRICSGAGDDRIFGGVGSDLVASAGGADEVAGGNGSDKISGGSGADVLLGNRGNDRLNGGAGGDHLDGGLGDDSVAGGPGAADRVIGGVGNDRLAGGPGPTDVLVGGHGRDHLDGGPGGHDVASYAISGFTGANPFGGTGVFVSLREGRALGDGTDRLAAIEDAVGTPFRDRLEGGPGPNELYGGGGPDQLQGGGDGDRAFGGAGSDACFGFVAEDACGSAPELPTASLEVELTGGADRGTLTMVVRNPPPSPPLFAPSLVGIGARLSFAGGAWLLEATPLPLLAGEGCETISATSVRCPVEGGPVVAFLDGGAGDDWIEVESGVPSYVSTVINGEAGADELLGGAGEDSIAGSIAASAAPVDRLFGRGGEDALANGVVLAGGAGSDLLIGEPCSGQAISGGAGIDSVSFARVGLGRGVAARLGGGATYVPAPGQGSACPPGSAGPGGIAADVERIEGSRGDDVFFGSGGANTLLGRAGDDRLEGGDGDDILVGGKGRDELRGGPAFDRLYANDRARDRALSCGAGGGVAMVDPGDPTSQGCGRIEGRG